MDPRYVAEFIGTLVLVLVGCGSIALGGFAAGPAGALQVGVAFGLTWTAVTYTIGQSSGAHLNPAITVAMWTAGRANSRDVLRYIVAQCFGAIVGAGILVFVIWAKTGSVSLPTLNLGQNVYGAGYGVTSVLIVELVATIVFALVVLGVTGGGRLASPVAGIVIGFTLIALHVAFFAVDGLSINPARSIGPAVWVRGIALVQLWMFIMVPIMGGAAAGWLYRSKTIG
jgi:aquaporin Z